MTGSVATNGARLPSPERSYGANSGRSNGVERSIVAMTDLLGLPLALFLVVAGLVVFVAAWFVHWLLLILAAVLIVAGIYVFVVGGSLPI